MSRVLRAAVGALAGSRREVLVAVASGYLLMGAHIGVQLILVPVYLQRLGKPRFGILMVLLAVANLSGVGIGWMSGGILRILGEAAAREDWRAFARAYAIAKAVHVAYGLLVGTVLVGVGLGFPGLLPGGTSAGPSPAPPILALALYLLVSYDFAVERLALVARKRQTAANLLQVGGLLLFLGGALLWLRRGGGLPAVLLCLTSGAAASRIGAWVYWRWTRARVALDLGALRGLDVLKRMMGSMGAGYAAFGALVLALQADTILVGWLGGAGLVAEFVLVWKIAEVLVQILWRVPESLQPYVIQMDARGESESIQRVGREGSRWMLGLSLLAAAGYALGGRAVVAAWVGAPQAPDRPWAYALAGAAVFWLGVARLPAVLAFATVSLGGLLRVAGIEAAGRLVLILLLFPRAGYLAPMLATNIVHAGGVAWAYRRLLRKV